MKTFPNSSRRLAQFAFRSATLFCGVLLLAGCVTAKKYKLAASDTPPARPLGWSVSVPPATLTLESVIVYKGPGSWKREASWDEYVVRVANQGERPLTLETVTLIDVLGNPQIPGTNPWELEKLSHINWDKYGKTELQVLAGAAVVGVAVSAASSAATSGLMGGSGAVAGSAAALTVIPLVAVVNIVAVAAINHNRKIKLEAEFDHRRLKLPLVVAPGANVAGSFFFPMTPGPQRLTVRIRAGEQAAEELRLDLKPLAGLHLKSSPAAPAGVPTTPPHS